MNIKNAFKKLDAKIAGQKIKVVKSERPKTIANLMEALKQSVKESDKQDKEEKVIPIRKRA